jgi:hypothetical protein
MIELFVVFQMHTDKDISVSDIIIPLPKWLGNKEVINLVKESIAAIPWAGAILNIINLNAINPPKAPAPVAKEYVPSPRSERSARPERTFSPRKEHTAYAGRPSRDDARPPRRDGDRPFKPREAGRKDREHRPTDSREWFAPRGWSSTYHGKSADSYGGKRHGGGFRGKSSRPSHAWRSR